MMAQSLIERLLELSTPVVAIASSAARMVWQEEMAESFGVVLERWRENSGFSFYSNGDFLAPIASGTYPTRGMAIMPCSMATLAAIAIGMANNLVRRAADVCLKERRPLVIVPRETPLTVIQLENMTKMASLGAIIVPPEPAFYLHPSDISDVVDFVVERTILALGITEALPERFQYRGIEGEG